MNLPYLIDKFDKDRIDCASYRLCVGEHVFTTSDQFDNCPPNSPLVSTLSKPPNNILRIRPGQFAFLMTEETVKVPKDAIALISMRAGYKFKGLINVSGFHVDPGWDGKLLFSVYNAGPSEVILERGDAAFLIVYADLDRKSNKVYDGKSQNQTTIKSSLLQNMTQQVFSPLMLQRRVEDFEKKVNDVHSSLVVTKAIVWAVNATVVLFIAVAALFSTFAPNTLGVILGKIIENGGYELKQKASSSSETDSAPSVKIFSNNVKPIQSATPREN
ncbi:dCTP deaminase domain-containing protein [Delftia lacustris]|uniref:dCTP deaminase domain-containing protein n=1 Tax=Delftia lacustris TaxID=558537 RepID=UPI001FCBA3B9|nr:hypothetical protein [Delftia lacustris]